MYLDLIKEYRVTMGGGYNAPLKKHRENTAPYALTHTYYTPTQHTHLMLLYLLLKYTRTSSEEG